MPHRLRFPQQHQYLLGGGVGVQLPAALGLLACLWPSRSISQSLPKDSSKMPPGSQDGWQRGERGSPGGYGSRGRS